MRIISRRTLKEFWEKHSDVEGALKTWYARVKRAKWKIPSDVKVDYRNASFIENNRVIFNIKGNSYRLVTAIHYQSGIVYIRFIGTHKVYNKIDASTI
jgi:mRNA interferase HigB